VGLKTQPLGWLCGITTTVTATIVAVSIGNFNGHEGVFAQTTQKIAPPSPLVQPKALRSTSQFCPGDLALAITSIVRSPKFETAQWGILIEPLAEPATLYRYNPDALLIPASNVKLLTTAAALRMVDDRTPKTFATLEKWIQIVNRESDNASADALLRHIGGQNAVRRVLTSLGVNPASYTQFDGSGLSRKNRVKPSTFVQLLKGMYTADENGVFYSSLPVAGVSGTLRNRFRKTPVEGKVHAKTGTLNGVRALSGYLEAPNYGTIAFSIVVNQSEQSGDVLVQAIDQIVLQTAQVTRCD
jgi:D-alanyl-D-alanine carboxypeptidase/D-alanyl-D-alanine-endopeptidase (penicillin-binding protein 4)